VAVWVQVAGGASPTFALYSHALKVSRPEQPRAARGRLRRRRERRPAPGGALQPPPPGAAPPHRRRRVPARVRHRLAPRLRCRARAALLAGELPTDTVPLRFATSHQFTLMDFFFLRERHC